MHYHFIAEPMRDSMDTLLGIEMVTRFSSDTVHPLHSDFIVSAWNGEQKRKFMLEQLQFVADKREWFEKNTLFCTIKLIDEMALLAIGDPEIKSVLYSMPFIALELSERFLSNTACLNNLLINSLREGPNTLWLGDLGSGCLSAGPLVSGHFDVVKMDRGFFMSQVEKPMFPVLIKNIREYCDRVVIEGLEDTRLIDDAINAGIWAIQGGIFSAVTFDEVDTLIPAEILH
ncbi:EAL domain-containing protein [Salmonella enterica subsp. enterica serovar Saintpaul]|nr:EAL domain-containing protein [Salmonella enterica subsp. enterica serovar Saintpaul]